MSHFWILLELRMVEVVVTAEAIRHAKLQANHQQTNTQPFTGDMPFLSPNQQCQSTEGSWYTHWSLMQMICMPLLLVPVGTAAIFIISSSSKTLNLLCFGTGLPSCPGN